MFKITWKLIQTLQRASNDYIDDNRFLRKQLYRKDEERNRVLGEIKYVITELNATNTEKLEHVYNIAKANKIELSHNRKVR